MPPPQYDEECLYIGQEEKTNVKLKSNLICQTNRVEQKVEYFPP